MNFSTDILFVVPSSRPRFKEESIGTLIIAKKAQLAGYNVKIARYWNVYHTPSNNYMKFRDEFVSYILSQNPKIISFYCRCEEYHVCIDLSRLIKEKNKKIQIAFGGPQAELVAKETLNNFSYVDYICCSEGEKTIVPFLMHICNNKIPITSVEGLTYRDNLGQIHQNRFPDFLEDNYIRQYNYYDLIPSEIMNGCDDVYIDVGRGCPFSCIYCSTKTFWKRKYRLRNINNIINEIDYVSSTYGITTFNFMHDLFTVDKKRITYFCKELNNRKLKIKWSCDSRIGTIDEETINLMIESGLYQIFFGIETGSDRMQDFINKHLDLEECDKIIKYCIDKGLKVTTSFIYGFPEESETDLNKTLKMAVRFQNYGCKVLTNLCHIMNGTELYARYKDNLKLTKDVVHNRCIPAFVELYHVIEHAPQMFANFCDFPNDLREEMKYIDVFRYSLNFAKQNLPQEHIKLLGYDYGSLSMYRSFCLANKEVFRNSDGDVTNIRKKQKPTSPETYKIMIYNLISKLMNTI